MEVSSAFQNVGHKDGLEVWRVRDFKPELVPKDSLGKFYSGDSYIILKTTALKSGGLAHAIHFWLGQDSTADEQGSAAIFTVELDTVIGGKAVQYREVQGSESDLFLSYFRPCIIPLSGGSPSGFHHVKPEVYESRLFLCRGGRFVRVLPVPLARSSLDQSDVFVLDTASKIFQFNGANSSMGERAKALEVVAFLRDSHHDGKCAVAVIDAAKMGTDADTGEFWEVFGGFAPISKHQKGVVGDESPGALTEGKLTRVFKGGSEAKTGQLMKSALTSENCYTLDCGAIVYIWTGRLSKPEDRKAALAFSQELTVKDSRPASTKVVRIAEGYEDPIFTSNFDGWPKSVAHAAGFDARSKMAARLKMQGLDVKGMVKGVNVQATPDSAASHLVDPTGKLEVWRIDDFDKTAVPQEEFGRFYSGDCYIVLYTYKIDRREEYLLYFWLGRDSTADEKGTAALLTVQLDESLRGRPVQVRVVQGKEPEQFLALFKGTMIVSKGGNSSGFKRISGGSAGGVGGESNPALFHVRNYGPLNTKAVQVDTAASSLNSSDCFVLRLKSTLYVWYGNFSSPEEQKVAVDVGKRLLQPGMAVKELKEGKEVGVFWDALGGRTDYASQKEARDPGKNPRLFHCSNATGTLKVTEVYNYVQDDLESSDVMILDTWNEVFVWIGYLANEKEKKLALDFAQEYIKQEGLPADTPIVKVSEGHEPVIFTSHFTWDSEKLIFVDPYEKRLAALQNRTPVQAVVPEGQYKKRRPSSNTVGAPLQTPSRVRTSSSPMANVKANSETPMGSPLSATSQHAAAMAALSGVLNAERQSTKMGRGSSSSIDSDWVAVSSPVAKLSGKAPTPSSPMSPATPVTSDTPNASQRAAAIAALSPALAAEHLGKKQESSLDGGWVKVGSPTKAKEASMAPLQLSSPPPSVPEVEEPVVEVASTSTTETVEPSGSISYESLTNAAGALPPGVDITKRETYLSDDDFSRVFQMSKQDFGALPKWKQDKIKKSLDLF